MRLRASWGAALACAVAVACSTFGNDDGQPPATPEDAGASDGSVPPAPPPPPADAGSGCVPDAHTLCDDFEGHGLPGPWDDFTSALPAKVAIVTTDKSSSHVLSITQDDLDGGPAGTAMVWKTVNRADVTRVVCALSLYINKLGPQGNSLGSLLHYVIVPNADTEVGAATASFDPSGSASVFVAYFYPSDGGNGFPAISGASALPIGRWLRVTFDMDFATRAYSVGYDGTTLINGTIPLAITKTNGMQIGLGVGSSDVVADYLVDDVVCDTTP